LSTEPWQQRTGDATYKMSIKQGGAVDVRKEKFLDLDTVTVTRTFLMRRLQ